MPLQKRTCSPLPLGERQELSSKLGQHLTVERYKIGDKNAEEDCEQEQWVFERFSLRLSLFDQQTCSLCSRLGFRSGKTLNIVKWRYQRDLKLDFFAT